MASSTLDCFYLHFIFSLRQHTHREKSLLIYPQCFARQQVKGWRGKSKFMYLHTFGRGVLDYFIFTHKLRNINIHGRCSRWQLTLSGALLPFFLPCDETNFNHLWFILPECNRDLINSAAIRVERGRKKWKKEWKKIRGRFCLKYWPGARSFRKGWRTWAKFSCLRGDWWPAIGPLGSSASPRRYADNPVWKQSDWGWGGTHKLNALLICLTSLEKGTLLNSSQWAHVWGADPQRKEKKRKKGPKGCCRYCRCSVSSTWVRLHVPSNVHSRCQLNWSADVRGEDAE